MLAQFGRQRRGKAGQALEFGPVHVVGRGHGGCSSARGRGKRRGNLAHGFGTLFVQIDHGRPLLGLERAVVQKSVAARQMPHVVDQDTRHPRQFTRRGRLLELGQQIGPHRRLHDVELIIDRPAELRQQQIDLRHPGHIPPAQEAVAQIVEQLRRQQQRHGPILGQQPIRRLIFADKPVHRLPGLLKIMHACCHQSLPKPHCPNTTLPKPKKLQSPIPHSPLRISSVRAAHQSRRPSHPGPWGTCRPWR